MYGYLKHTSNKLLSTIVPKETEVTPFCIQSFIFKMSSNSQSSLESETTFCSEIELAELRRSSNFKQTMTSSHIISPNSTERRQEKPCVYESFGNYSSPLLLTCAEYDESMPPSQLHLKSNHTENNNRPSQVTFQPEYHKIEQHSFCSRYMKDKTSKTAKHSKEIQNRIFETNDSRPTYFKYKSTSRDDNFDTVSISSENVSKIVDKEIALYRKKKTQRNLHAQHYCLTQMGQLHNIRSCSHATKQTKPRISAVANKKQHLKNDAHVERRNPKQYNLTGDQLKEVAYKCRISINTLKTAIERVLGKETGEQDSEDCDEVNCSQSPIKRRYLSSQLTYTSNVSK